ncbi:MAG: hypothetical protein ABSH56_18540 [Bryobacteraceae bacterium]|jgi:hypothetical protein
MRFRIAILGVLSCLAALAAGNPGQGASPNKSDSSAEQRLIGCVDEQDGHYVLLNDQMQKIAGLQSAASGDEMFARFMGHEVRVTGAPSAQQGTFKVTGIEQVSDSCRQAK